jgi:hypothetical protein
VRITTQGKFRIAPPPYKDDDDAADDANAEIVLPARPEAPRGQWKPKSSILDFAAMGMWDQHAALAALTREPRSYDFLPELIRDQRRDPNGFYYKPTRPSLPANEILLECEQWRHNVDTENFEVRIIIDENVREVKGMIECQVHAENLLDSSLLRVPVRIVVTSEAIYDFAISLITPRGRPIRLPTPASDD